MLKEVPFEQLEVNVMELFAKEWGLLTAGTEDDGFNAMTISWGMLGSLWTSGHDTSYLGVPVCEVFVRPQRYTKEFMDRQDTFTVCFFGPEMHISLGYMGSHSGRDGDKIAIAGLTPMHLEDGAVIYEEAKLALVCQKLYQDPMEAERIQDPMIVESMYPEGDCHELYIGKIIRTYEDA